MHAVVYADVVLDVAKFVEGLCANQTFKHLVWAASYLVRNQQSLPFLFLLLDYLAMLHFGCDDFSLNSFLCLYTLYFKVQHGGADVGVVKHHKRE